MTKNKRFWVENERILNTYVIRIFKDDEIIFEVNNWNSLSETNKVECEGIANELNKLSDENEELKSVNMEYEDALGRLEKENEELISIKCFADRHGINIFNIDEAFRRCWNDNENLVKENKHLKELLELISIATSFTKEESVKEILRHEIKAIDTVTEDSAMAWHDYCVLSNFFKKQYGEHWDNE